MAQSKEIPEILEFLDRATVKIRQAHTMGTGFWVGERLILTCAHVVKKAAGERISVQFSKEMIECTVVQSDEELDLALLQIVASEPPAHHTLALDMEAPTFEQSLVSYGFSDEYPDGDMALPSVEGFSKEPLRIKLRWAQFRPGFSGAPLLSLSTGGVSGVMVKTRNRTVDLGGRAILNVTVCSFFPALADQPDSDPCREQFLDVLDRDRLVGLTAAPQRDWKRLELLERNYVKAVERGESELSEDLSRLLNDAKRRLRVGVEIQTGETLGCYLLLNEIGQGGFGRVFKARDSESGRFVAVKVLHTSLARDASRVERFARGARVMRELRHNNIVKVLQPANWDEKKRVHYFVMEYIDGKSLEKAAAAPDWQRADILPTLRQIAEALTFAHVHGAIHRDVSPANVLFDGGKNAHLTDFDLVLFSGDTGGTGPNEAMGRFIYAASEVMSDAADADVRADVYSLAMTAVFLYFGEALTFEVIHNRERFIRALPISSGVQGVLLRATAVYPEKRYKSVEGFLAELERASAARIDISKVAKVAIGFTLGLVLFIVILYTVYFIGLSKPPPYKTSGNNTDTVPSLSQDSEFRNDREPTAASENHATPNRKGDSPPIVDELDSYVSDGLLQGKLIRRSTREPVVGADVVALDSSFSSLTATKSDGSGSYELELTDKVQAILTQPPTIERSGYAVYREPPFLRPNVGGESNATWQLSDVGNLVILAYRDGQALTADQLSEYGSVSGKFLHAASMSGVPLEAISYWVRNTPIDSASSVDDLKVPAVLAELGKPFRITALFWPIPDYGKLAVRADNAGKGFEFTVPGEIRLINLNFELARTAVHHFHERTLQFESLEGVSIVRDQLQQRLAEIANIADGAEQARASDMLLADALRLRDEYEFEHAKRQILNEQRKRFEWGIHAPAPFDAADVSIAREAGFRLATTLTGWNWTENPDLKEANLRRILGIDGLRELGYERRAKGAIWISEFLMPEAFRREPVAVIVEAALHHQRQMLSVFADDFRYWDAVHEPAQALSYGLGRDQLTQLVAEAAQNVKAAGLVPMISGADEVALFNMDSRNQMPGLAFEDTFGALLSRMSIHGALNDIEAIGLEIYSGGALAHSLNDQPLPAYPPAAVLDMVNSYTRFGKEIHITAFSCPSRLESITKGGYWKRPWDESTQAEYVRIVYTLLFAHPNVSSISWADLSDKGATVYGGGLLFEDGQKKPAFDAVAELIAGAPVSL